MFEETAYIIWKICQLDATEEPNTVGHIADTNFYHNMAMKRIEKSVAGINM